MVCLLFQHALLFGPSLTANSKKTEQEQDENVKDQPLHECRSLVSGCNLAACFSVEVSVVAHFAASRYSGGNFYRIRWHV